MAEGAEDKPIPANPAIDFIAEQASDRRLGHRMRRLESAVRSREPTRIKDEAQAAIDPMTKLYNRAPSTSRWSARSTSPRSSRATRA